MDIMDSTDTPTGGLDGTTASSSTSSASSSGGALPLSVDQRDDFSPSTDSVGGARPTSTIAGESSATSGSAFDRLDAVTGGNPRIDEDLPNALPTSTDDVYYPQQEYATHPSVLGQDADATLSRTTQATSLSSKADSARDSASNVAASAKDQASRMASASADGASQMAASVKSSASSIMDSLSKGFHTAEDKASAGYDTLKKDVSAHMPHSSTSTSTATVDHPVRSTSRGEDTETTTHPDAASMRDSHLHSNFASLPTHENEVRPSSTAVPHVSAAQAKGLEAAAGAVEPKDASAGDGLRGMIARAHGKMEEGAEMIKERVDNFAEAHLRSTPKAGDHLSESRPEDIPTLVDSSNEKNNEKVKARLHSSSERAGANSIQDPAIPLADDSV